MQHASLIAEFPQHALTVSPCDWCQVLAIDLAMGTTSIALPAILEEICEVVGLEAALAIAQARGGQEVYFPSNPGPDHWLAQCIGQAEAQTLCAYFSVGGSGIHILVPTGRNALARVRAEEALARGLSVSKVAAIAGIHERTVYRIKRELKGQV